MVMAPQSLREDYWESFELQNEDIEFIYARLLDVEEPLTPKELIGVLVGERIRREMLEIEQQRNAGGDAYMPKERYQVDQTLVFPAHGWEKGIVTGVRPGENPDLGPFDVIRVTFDEGEVREYAAGLEDHILNQPQQIEITEKSLNPGWVLAQYEDDLVAALEDGLQSNPDFVRIAGRWFARALLVDINIGHLNLAEAVLDMAGGGPLPTAELLAQIGLTSNANPRLLEFSLDMALQEDGRFDEVGSTGTVLWYLQRLEPDAVKEPPLMLRYAGIEYDRAALNDDMLGLERELDDELSPLSARSDHKDEVSVCLIYPHWRAGTLPLSSRLRHLFPTAYESPRIQFNLVDGDSGEKLSGWVVRGKRYVFGLREWYEKHNLIPGSLIRVRRGKKPGEVIIFSDSQRSSREWIRTVLVGSDGGLVFAMLKQIVSSSFDERMVIAIPDANAVDLVWERGAKDRTTFERAIVNIVRELAKLNPQGHVHASELYAALNVVRRCPPGPILALLASRPSFVHVGDLHFRYVESDNPA
jgi:hypothetical protein